MKKLDIILLLVCVHFAWGQKQITPSSVQVYTTAKETNERLSASATALFAPAGQPFETQICIFVDPAKKFQTFMGIGGAITDASAEVFAALSPEKQQEFLDSYYSKSKGIGYTLARTNIHSCDFSSSSYTYVTEGDAELNSFSVAHDKKFRIPLIKKAMQTAGNLNVYASPWSPPAFMKTNGDMLQGGSLKPMFYQVWANYFVKFIQAYEKEGIPIWGISVQNEPMAKQRWESCIYSAEEERDFLKNNLGPTLEKSGLACGSILL